MRINRVLLGGVITEVEKLGSEAGNECDLWKARISDPTGVFIVYAGQYQPEAAIFLSTVSVPSYVAVVGKARAYEPEKDSVFISIRPEEINSVEGTIRDRWVLDTAELTLKRLDLLSEILSDQAHGGELSEHMRSNGPDTGSSEAVLNAVAFYGTDQNYISKFRQSVRKALLFIKENAGLEIQQKGDAENLIVKLLKELNNGKGVQYSCLLKEVGSQRVPEEVADAAVRSLLAKGECYEPKHGVIKLV